MGKEEDQPHDPDYLHQLKTKILDSFRALPAEHQATVALVITVEVINAGEYGDWLRQAIELSRPNDGIEDNTDLPML